MYVFFVVMNGIDADTFWNSDISFLDEVVDDIHAYRNYINNPKEA